MLRHATNQFHKKFNRRVICVTGHFFARKFRHIFFAINKKFKRVDSQNLIITGDFFAQKTAKNLSVLEHFTYLLSRGIHHALFAMENMGIMDYMANGVKIK